MEKAPRDSRRCGPHRRRSSPGAVVEMTCDGMLAILDGPGRAIRCAFALGEFLRPEGSTRTRPPDSDAQTDQIGPGLLHFAGTGPSLSHKTPVYHSKTFSGGRLEKSRPTPTTGITGPEVVSPTTTVFDFILPRGYFDEGGRLHRTGVMRLATAHTNSRYSGTIPSVALKTPASPSWSSRESSCPWGRWRPCRLT